MNIIIKGKTKNNSNYSLKLIYNPNPNKSFIINAS